MSVHFSGHTNSTHFTDCCNCAVTERQDHCPICKKELPSYRDRDETAMQKLFGVDGLRKMRAENDRKWAEAERRSAQARAK